MQRRVARNSQNGDSACFVGRKSQYIREIQIKSHQTTGFRSTNIVQCEICRTLQSFTPNGFNVMARV